MGIKISHVEILGEYRKHLVWTFIVYNFRKKKNPDTSKRAMWNPGSKVLLHRECNQDGKIWAFWFRMKWGNNTRKVGTREWGQAHLRTESQKQRQWTYSVSTDTGWKPTEECAVHGQRCCLSLPVSLHSWFGENVLLSSVPWKPREF